MAYPLLLLLSLLVFFFFFFFHVGHGNPELRALMELKSSLDPGGRYLSSWTPGGDQCRGHFEGVACNEHGKVENISLQGKGLSGSISPAVKELRCLSGLYLHYNSLTGNIPREIGNLTELTDLYLNFNNLSGGIPAEIGTMASLQVLQLCYNRLTGSIPTQLSLLSKLSVLALQSNQLAGAIPASLGDLQELVRLDLSFNKLFGSIPTKLAQLPKLSFFDVRNNSLSGNVPSELQRLNKSFQFENNKGLCGDEFLSLRSCTSSDPLNPDRPEPQEIPQSANFNQNCSGSRCSNHWNSSHITVITSMIVVSVGALISGLLVLVWYRRRKQRIGSALEISVNRVSTDVPKDLPRKSASPLISLEYSSGWDPLADCSGGGSSSSGFYDEVQSFRFNLEEIECATQYFSELNLLGKGNFAAVYRGILRDGSPVAVRSITKSSCKSEEAEFLKGLKTLTLLRHENLVGLKGFCCSRGRGECFLLYDFVSNGSLSSYLDLKEDEKDKVLDWSTRVSIAIGIAKGIEYLHSVRANKPSIVHQSISAEKILIDQDFAPKISAAGLHRLLADDVVFSTLKASAAMGYLAPEYTTTGRFTEKSDVYSFGVILLQILAGKMRVAHLRIAAETGQLSDLVDGNLGARFSASEAAKLAGIAMKCTGEIPDQRPKMEIVVQELEND
ncbi:putative LRR receptor-like serine/threonine-protein kinase RFK1 [Platanthera zijinensis]|uniref:LRR receptor-like serine/threonine-protein kinase RFK1 n=1 Tax=Platanthera zijinensis TaxID=2320716 RepID=A0AAP0BPS5_9ASPA